MITQKHFTYDSVVHGVEVAGYLWEPETDTPQALLIIAHGMTESMARYDDFAKNMAQRGILVAGKDHLGHGRSVKNEDELGYFGPVEYDNIQNADFQKLVDLMRERYPQTPLFVLGHSMGSFLMREYITKQGENIDGVILSGPGDINRLLVSFGRVLVDLFSLFRGQHYRSPFVYKLMFGAFNSRIPSPRTPFDWLTRDPDVVDGYCNHKENGFVFTLNGFTHFMLNIARVSQPQAFKSTPKTLPILLIGGGQDPVGDWGKALPSLAKKYRNAGVRDVEMKLYQDDRHEVINELNKAQVDDDIYAWISRHIHE